MGISLALGIVFGIFGGIAVGRYDHHTAIAVMIGIAAGALLGATIRLVAAHR